MLNSQLEWLTIAKMIMRLLPNDDGYFDKVCYNLQQSIEDGLKHIIELSGTDYPHTHNIDQLLLYIPVQYHSELEDVSNFSAIITRMEEETRYPSNFRASAELISKITCIAENLYAFVCKLDREHKTKYLEKEKREDILWHNEFRECSPEYVFCRNYIKEYKRLGAPTSKEGYDKATQFATKALYFANVPKEKIMSVINELAPMVPYQDEDKPYMLDIVNAVENMPDIKEFMKNQSENENSIKSR